MREYRIADLLGSAREAFSDYSELVGMDNWERAELSQVTEGLAVVPSKSARPDLQLIGNKYVKAEVVEIPPPSITPLNGNSLLRR